MSANLFAIVVDLLEKHGLLLQSVRTDSSAIIDVVSLKIGNVTDI